MIPCPACPREYAPIPGDGPLPARILFIGERPGGIENRDKRVFSGKTGQEVDNTYLPLAGLDRGHVRMCNAVACYADDNRTPTDAEIMSCAAYHLPQEINQCKPEVIVLLGASACKVLPVLFEGTLVSDDVDLEYMHGRPLSPVKHDPFAVWISYHPALGIHKTGAMSALLEDFENLGEWLNNRWKPPRPSNIKPNYSLIRAGCLEGARYASEIGVDTETHGGEPFSLQFSPAPGLAYLALAERDRWFFEDFNRLIQDKVCVLHNAPFDIQTAARMGVHIRKYRDTMQESFHHATLPQALKPLAYRLFGAEMRTWEDVVRPDSQNKAIEWLSEALQIADMDFCLFEMQQLKTKMKEIFKMGPVAHDLHRIIRYSARLEYDIWAKVAEMWKRPEIEGNGQREHIEARIGAMPILGIKNCRIEDAIEYACGDADWTLQVGRELERRRNDARFIIDAEDADVPIETVPVLP